MTDQELIKALRCCGYFSGSCDSCPLERFGNDCPALDALAADRLEALLSENEALDERDKAHKELEQALERKCAALTVQNELLRHLNRLTGDTDAEVRHGKWCRTGRENVYSGIEIECSECGHTHMTTPAFLEEELWCCHCGARMDGGTDNGKD